MYRDMTVAVVVPAYNEEGYVGNVIDGLPAFVDRAYVVDDGSTDDTWAEIRTHASDRNDSHDGHFDDLVVPIQHDENRGVGGAIKTGYLRAREEEIDATAVLGGDDQMNPEVLTKYLDPIADGVAEYTKGNRFARPEDHAEMPRFRLFGNVMLSGLTKIASGYWGLNDSQNGYTAISLAALERTDIEGMYEYYGYCNDLLVRLNAAEVTVADVPRSSEYAYTDGWKSHIDYTEYVPRVSLMLLRSFLWRLRRKYLLTGYHRLAPMYLLGMGLLGTSVVGVLESLTSRDRVGVSTWLLTLTAGALTFLHASALDREQNEDLETLIDPDDSSPPAGGSDPDAPPAAGDGSATGNGTDADEDLTTVRDGGTLPAGEDDDANASDRSPTVGGGEE